MILFCQVTLLWQLPPLSCPAYPCVSVEFAGTTIKRAWEESPSESGKELCGPSASPSAQCLCQSFTSAIYPHCTQEGLISFNEQSQSKFSAEGSSRWLLFPLGLSPVLFQQRKGGAVPQLGLSACSFPLLWWKNVNLVCEAIRVSPSPLQAWVRGQYWLSHLLQLRGNTL